MKVLREPVELYRVDNPATEIEAAVKIRGDEYFVVFVAARGGWRYGVPAFGAEATYDLTRTGVVAADDGELVGTFSLDRDTQLFSLEDREILGVGKDSLDVEHVIVGRIREPF